MKVRMRPIGLAMAMLILAAGQAKAGNLIINGDFSQPDAATLPNDGSVYKFVYAGDPSLTGWTVTNGSVETDVTIPTFGAPTASGNPQNLDLDGNSAGTIAQSFATTAGQSYSLAFYYSDNPYGPGAAATVSVTDSSLTPLVITHSDATYGSLDWQYVQETFVATSNSATLTFRLERFALEYHRDSAGQRGGRWRSRTLVVHPPRPGQRRSRRDRPTPADGTNKLRNKNRMRRLG